MRAEQSAITVARQINTAEAQQSSTTKRYVPLLDLADVTVPEGFEGAGVNRHHDLHVFGEGPAGCAQVRSLLRSERIDLHGDAASVAI